MVPITIITLISYRHSHNFSCGSSNDIDQICIQNCRSGYLWANIAYKSTLNKEIVNQIIIRSLFILYIEKVICNFKMTY